MNNDAILYEMHFALLIANDFKTVYERIADGMKGSVHESKAKTTKINEWISRREYLDTLAIKPLTAEKTRDD